MRVELKNDKFQKDIAFFREQVAANRKQTPYGEGLPAPWAWLEAMCDVAVILSAQLSEAQARLAERTPTDPALARAATAAHPLDDVPLTEAEIRETLAIPEVREFLAAQSVADDVVRDAARWKAFMAVAFTDHPMFSNPCVNTPEALTLMVDAALLAAQQQKEVPSC